MERDPLDRTESPWIVIHPTFPFDGTIFRRMVRDGMLLAMVAEEKGVGWHMSISFRDRQGNFTRYPTWDELANAREELLPEHLDFAMHFPPKDEYVAVHPTTFHLYQTF